MWIRRVSKHGGSLVVVIPSEAAKEMDIQRGDYLRMALDSDYRELVIYNFGKKGKECKYGKMDT